jgi:uncharacterized membrane protein YkvI
MNALVIGCTILTIVCSICNYLLFKSMDTLSTTTIEYCKLLLKRTDDDDQ